MIQGLPVAGVPENAAPVEHGDDGMKP